MNANEIVVALRERADAANKRGYSGEASEWLELANLIERLEAEVKRWVDKHNQAALNFQQENAECRRLQEQLAAEKRMADAAVECIEKIDDWNNHFCYHDLEEIIDEWRGAKEERK